MRRQDPPSNLQAVGAALVAAGVFWYGLLMRPLWQAEAFGPICRHSGLVHCPACYAALAAVALGLSRSGLAAAGARLQTSGARKDR